MVTLNLDPLEPHRARFRELATDVCRRLHDCGIEVVPFRKPELTFFCGMELSRREALLRSLEAQRDVLARNPRSIDSWEFLRAYLAHMQLATAPDLESYAAPDDYIAVYDQFQGMMFLSPNHFRYITYPLEDMYCRLWLTIFRRDENLERVLLTRVFPFAHGERTATLSNMDLPAHIIAQTQTEDDRAMTVESKAYSPLFKSGRPSGFLAINHRVRPVNDLLPRPRGMKG